MLIEFTIENYRSIKDSVTFSMVAANLTAQDKDIDQQNTFDVHGVRLLRSAALYGPNAGGKSNVILALRLMRALVLRSARLRARAATAGVEPFLLSESTADAPTRLEVVCIIDGVQTRYGFTADTQTVHAEWCLQRHTQKERRLFTRQDGVFTIGEHFPEGEGLADRTRPDALLLSVAAGFNGPVAAAIVEWFRRLTISTNVAGTLYRKHSIREVEGGKYRQAIIRLITELDIGIDDIRVERHFMPMQGHEGQGQLQGQLSLLDSKPEVRTMHRAYTKEGDLGSPVAFDIMRQESAGTKKVFALSGLLIEALAKGRVVVIDELDAQLHPHLTAAIVRLFNSSETNPANAQLIFTTHDTHLIDRKTFRRDQIWLVDKDHFGATHVRSVAEFKGVRNDGSYEAQYMRGNFGGIPLIGDPGSALDAVRHPTDDPRDDQ